MQRIDHATAVGVKPDPQEEGTPGFFNYAPAGSGATPTVVSSDWLNQVQEELLAVIEAGGIEPSKTNTGQVLAAILGMIGASAAGSGGDIYGFTLSNTAGNTTTHITSSAGQCRDSTNTATLVNAAPFTKRLDQAWAAGNGNGGRLSGALANGQTWHHFAIYDPTTETLDFGFDQSPTAPTLPAGYTKFRRLGSVVLEAAATTIRQFLQIGDWFMLKLRSTDYAATANGAGPYLRQVTVPAGIKVEAKFYLQSTGTATSAPSVGYHSGVFDPDFGAPPAFGVSTQWAQVRRIGLKASDSSNNSYDSAIFTQFTDTSRQVYTYSNDNLDVIVLGVLGWRDERGKYF